MVLTSVDQDPMIDCMNMLHSVATGITAVIINKEYKKIQENHLPNKAEAIFLPFVGYFMTKKA